MKQKITDFHQDQENHWVADLECGHAQHMRHDPPWMERDWVTTAAGRESRLGIELNCVRCDEMAAALGKAILSQCIETLKESYEQAGISGLCNDGRWDFAISSIATIDLEMIAKNALKTKE